MHELNESPEAAAERLAITAHDVGHGKRRRSVDVLLHLRKRRVIVAHAVLIDGRGVAYHQAQVHVHARGAWRTVLRLSPCEVRMALDAFHDFLDRLPSRDEDAR